MGHAQLLLEFDAVYVWTLTGRVIIERMTTYLAIQRQNVFVEMEELETCMTDTEGIIGVLPWSACDHEGGRRFCSNEKKGDDAVG